MFVFIFLNLFFMIYILIPYLTHNLLLLNNSSEDWYRKISSFKYVQMLFSPLNKDFLKCPINKTFYASSISS